MRMASLVLPILLSSEFFFGCTDTSHTEDRRGAGPQANTRSIESVPLATADGSEPPVNQGEENLLDAIGVLVDGGNAEAITSQQADTACTAVLICDKAILTSAACADSKYDPVFFFRSHGGIVGSHVTFSRPHSKLWIGVLTEKFANLPWYPELAKALPSSSFGGTAYGLWRNSYSDFLPTSANVVYTGNITGANTELIGAYKFEAPPSANSGAQLHMDHHDLGAPVVKSGKILGIMDRVFTDRKVAPEFVNDATSLYYTPIPPSIGWFKDELLSACARCWLGANPEDTVLLKQDSWLWQGSYTLDFYYSNTSQFDYSIPGLKLHIRTDRSPNSHLLRPYPLYTLSGPGMATTGFSDLVGSMHYSTGLITISIKDQHTAACKNKVAMTATLTRPIAALTENDDRKGNKPGQTSICTARYDAALVTSPDLAPEVDDLDVGALASGSSLCMQGR